MNEIRNILFVKWKNYIKWYSIALSCIFLFTCLYFLFIFLIILPEGFANMSADGLLLIILSPLVLAAFVFCLVKVIFLLIDRKDAHNGKHYYKSTFKSKFKLIQSDERNLSDFNLIDEEGVKYKFCDFNAGIATVN